MRLTVRAAVTALALGFAIYFASRALWWTHTPTAPALMVGAIGLFIITIMATTLVGARGEPLPLWLAASTLIVSAIIPSVVSLSLAEEARRAPFATWYIGAIGLLAVICIVRQRIAIGWSVLAVLAAGSIAWLGVGDALGLGLVGSTVWVVIAQLLVTFWGRAIKDTERLAGIQQTASAWHATQRVRQRERRERVQYALLVAGPSLGRVIETHGNLSAEERLEARLAEGRLRDEIRGASLLNNRARRALETARRRGATVTVFDDGGLDEIDDAQRERVREELADVLQNASSARLIIRAPRDHEVAVTVVGRTARGETSEDDSLELWHEILRLPAREAAEHDEYQREQ